MSSQQLLQKPDINAGNKQYEEKLKEITLAYTFLNNSINKNTEVA